MTSALDRLAARLRRIEREQLAAKSPQLANSSIEDGALRVNAADGTETMVIGKQFDGTQVAASVVGPTPPTPAAPVVEEIVFGLKVKFDGTFADGSVAPMDFARFEIHASTTGPDFTADLGTTLLATMESPRGGEQSVMLPAGVYYIRIVARSLSGKGSAPSVAAEPASPQLIKKVDFDAEIDLDGIANTSEAAQAAADQAATDAAAAIATADAANDAAVAAALAASAAQATADGSIRTYYQSAAPWADGSTQPATSVGDLWYDQDDGQAYRWNGSSWQIIEDNSIATALAAAAAADARAAAAESAAAAAAATAGSAATSADGASRVWYTANTPPTTARVNRQDDSWFKLDGTGKIVGFYYWDASGAGAWVERPINHQAIATLDLGKATVGELDAIYLKAGSVTTREVSTDILIANSVYSREGYFGSVIANQIQAGNLAAVLALLGSLQVGSNISIDPANGIVINTPTGVIRFPADGQDANISANLTAKSLTVLGNLAIRGLTNEISKGSAVTLATGTTAPASAPQVSTGWTQKPIHEGFNPQGFAQGLGAYWTLESLGDVSVQRSLETGTQFEFQFGGSTNAMGAVLMAARPEIRSGQGGIAFIGNNAYLLCHTNEALPDSYAGRMYVYAVAWSGSEWSYTGRWLYEPTTPSSAARGGAYGKGPKIAVKGSNLLIAQCDSDGALVTHEYTPAGALVSSNPLLSDVGARWTPNQDVGSILYGTFDFATPRYLVAYANTAAALSFDATTKRRLPSDTFDLPSTDVRGMIWDTTVVPNRFRSRTTTAVYDHTSYVQDSTPLWVGTTWRKNNTTPPAFATAETQVSPLAQITPRKRASVFVATAPIPDDAADPNDADSISVYIGRKASAPTNAELFRQTVPALGVNTVRYDAITLSGSANPPTTNSFTNQAPATFASVATDGSGALAKVQGDGSWRLGAFSGAPDGKVGGVAPTDAATLTYDAPSGLWKPAAPVAPAAPAVPPYLIARGPGTAQSAPNGWNVVDLASVESVSGTGATDPTLTASTDSVLINKDGLYALTAFMAWATTVGTSARRMCQIETYTGTAPAAGSGTNQVRHEQAAAATVYASHAISTEAFLTAGTRVRVAAYQASGAALDIRHDLVNAKLTVRRIL